MRLTGKSIAQNCLISIIEGLREFFQANARKNLFAMREIVFLFFSNYGFHSPHRSRRIDRSRSEPGSILPGHSGGLSIRLPQRWKSETGKRSGPGHSDPTRSGKRFSLAGVGGLPGKGLGTKDRPGYPQPYRRAA